MVRPAFDAFVWQQASLESQRLHNIWFSYLFFQKIVTLDKHRKHTYFSRGRILFSNFVLQFVVRAMLLAWFLEMLKMLLHMDTIARNNNNVSKHMCNKTSHSLQQSNWCSFVTCLKSIWIFWCFWILMSNLSVIFFSWYSWDDTKIWRLRTILRWYFN